jgi:hypothetical protein
MIEIAVAISHSFDSLNLVVQPFCNAIRKRKTERIGNSLSVLLEESQFLFEPERQSGI